jgi:aminoglycoside phosphotransferase (APT) family kinase protein
MSTLSAASAPAHLRRRGLLQDGAVATALTGGVSGAVVLVEAPARRLVVKQALPRLSVATEWFAKPERALTEAAAIEALHRLTPDHTPELVDVDADRLVVTMTAAPAHWRPWKELLLAGNPPGDVATTLGRVLGIWHDATRGDPATAARFADYEAFEQLRVAPFHRTVRRRHPALAGAVDACVTDLTTTRECLVHGDFSPKNVLVGPDGLWVLDFEVAHVGAPVFDVAFLLCHLMLKAAHRPGSAASVRAAADAFLDAYGPAPLDRLGWHTACLLLARVDGTSPADYLTPAERTRVRAVATAALDRPDSPTLDELWELW